MIETMPMTANLPSVAMIGGIMPVVSDGSQVLLRSPNGWQAMNLYGFIAGDGGSQIVANENPVKYGCDGNFYSTIYENGQCRAVRWTNGEWEPLNVYFGGSGWFSICQADMEGSVFLAYQDRLAMQRENGQAELTWPGKISSILQFPGLAKLPFRLQKTFL
jgi:hypothetical protein